MVETWKIFINKDLDQFGELIKLLSTSKEEFVKQSSRHQDLIATQNLKATRCIQCEGGRLYPSFSDSLFSYFELEVHFISLLNSIRLFRFRYIY